MAHADGSEDPFHITHLLGAHGFDTYDIGCRHRPLMFVTVDFKGKQVFMSVLLDDRTLELVIRDGRRAYVHAVLPPIPEDDERMRKGGGR